MFIYAQNTFKQKMVKIGSVGGEIWWTGTEKQGPRRGQLGHVAPTCKLQAQGYLWVSSLNLANWGHHAKSTF